MFRTLPLGRHLPVAVVVLGVAVSVACLLWHGPQQQTSTASNGAISMWPADGAGPQTFENVHRQGDAATPLQLVQLGLVQFGQSSGRGPQIMNVFLPVPRELRQQLFRAQRSVEDEQYADAVAEIGALLSKLESGGADGVAFQGDYFIGERNVEGAQESLRSAALKLLGSMPPKGLAWYELQYGAEGRLVLDQALESRDIGKLAEVARRFFHTQAGYEATLLLGRYHLSRGRPVAAALALRRLADSPAAAPKFEPELSILLATCWLKAGSPELAKTALVAARHKYPGLRFRLGDERVAWFDNDAGALPWLGRYLGEGVEAGSTLGATEWVMHRGDGARNAVATGGPPVKTLKWATFSDQNVWIEKRLDDLEKQYQEQRNPLLPTASSLVVGDTVIARLPNYLFGINKNTGVAEWHYPWNRDYEEEYDQAGMNGLGHSSQVMQPIMQRVWEDHAYGQLASDGRCVFFLDELGYAGLVNFATIMGRGGQRQDSRFASKKTNMLVALELETEGKLHWRVGGDGGDEPKLAGAFFLGPPLPLGRQLYVMAEVNGEIRLVALDAETGRQEWSQQLAHVDTYTIDRNSGRRLVGATPSYADGVVVCPTSAGAVVAVDLSTRSLLWGFQYPTSIDPRRARFHIGYHPQRNFSPGTGWFDATATLADGKALITPPESGKLYCLDLLTGKKLWERDRNESLFIGSVQDGVTLLVGKESVEGVRLGDGKTAWSAVRFPGGGLTGGRGYAAPGFYFQPTSKSQLLKIQVKDGKILEQIPTERPLGNLVCQGELIVSHNVTMLTAYEQLGRLKESVSAQLEKNPDDPAALLSQGELLLSEGNPEAAAGFLRRSLATRPAAKTRRLLTDTLLDLLEADFAAHRGSLDEVKRLVREPPSAGEAAGDLDAQMRLQRILAPGHRAAQEYAAAWEALRDLMALRRTQTARVNVDADEAMIEDRGDPALARRIDRWIGAELAALQGEAPEPTLVAIRDQLAAVASEVISTGDWAKMEAALAHVVGSPIDGKLRAAVCKKALGARHFLSAEQHGLWLRASDDAQDRLQADALLAQIYAAAGHDLLATVMPADGAAGDAEEREKLFDSKKAWPPGKGAVETSSDSDLGIHGYQQIFPLTNLPSADGLPFLRRAELNAQRNGLTVLDAWGAVIAEADVTTQQGRRLYQSSIQNARSRFHGHLALLGSYAGDILALNALREPGVPDQRLLWSYDISDSLAANVSHANLRARAAQTPWGVARIAAFEGDREVRSPLGPVTRYGFVYLRGGKLVCADPLTGAVHWSRDDVPRDAWLFGSDEAVIVASPDRDSATAVSPLTGRWLQGGRPLVLPSRNWIVTEVGAKLLAWQEQDGRRGFRLYDPLTGKNEWFVPATAGVRAQMLSEDLLAMAEPDGKLNVVRVDTGAAVVRDDWGRQENLAAVYGLASREHVVVLTHEELNKSTGAVHYSNISFGKAPLVTGKRMCYDRATGKRLWEQPREVMHYGMPAEQPPESPVIVLARHARRPSQNRGLKMETSLVLIDRRTGEEILNKDDLPTQTGGLRMEAEPLAGRFTLLAPNHGFVVNYAGGE